MIYFSWTKVLQILWFSCWEMPMDFCWCKVRVKKVSIVTDLCVSIARAWILFKFLVIICGNHVIQVTFEAEGRGGGCIWIVSACVLHQVGHILYIAHSEKAVICKAMMSTYLSVVFFCVNPCVFCYFLLTRNLGLKPAAIFLLPNS